MSVQAWNWALEEAPDVPPHLVAPLLGLANHADQNGRGAYCSTATLAWYTRKGRDASRNDLDRLEALGLIRRGDQRMVLHIPPDDRPVVYDLCMEKRRAPRPDRRNGGRPRKDQLTTPEKTGGVSTPPRFSDEKPGGSVAETGGVCSGNRGGLQTPLTVLEPPMNQNPRVDLVRTPPAPRPRTGGDDPPDPDPTPSLFDEGAPETAIITMARIASELFDLRRWSRPSSIRAMEQAMADGHTLAEVEQVIRRLADDPDTRAPGRLLVVPADYWTTAAQQARPAAPAWCGEPTCNPDTRRRFHPDTHADAGRCPTCHYRPVSPTGAGDRARSGPGQVPGQAQRGGGKRTGASSSV